VKHEHVVWIGIRTARRLASDLRTGRRNNRSVLLPYCVHAGTDRCFLLVTRYVGVISDPVKDFCGQLDVLDDLILRVYNRRR
jgi:hypothetical protein